MQMTTAYSQRSKVMTTASAVALALSPNLRRDKVSYCGQLKNPLLFREAISALHDVVISDLRFTPKDKTAYKAYLAEQARLDAAIRSQASQQMKQQLVESSTDLPEGFEAKFNQARKKYWKKRDQYNDYLKRHDPTLWRQLMPCDPVITVANDVLLFECFSADESSYGCLSVDRAQFHNERSVALGTTNVDYTWDLYDHFQQLRSYRQTEFSIDPGGFEVKTTAAQGHHEEKIDLPESWLKGFLQTQAAMSMPLRKVPLTREAIYSILAFLKRNKAKKSPRALRFDLETGKPIRLALEPWNKEVTLPTTIYEGRTETIRIWGRNRLQVLARLLPVMEKAEVFLLGTGFPSFWVIYLNGMRFTLGLSSWTANDWTGTSGLDQLAPPAEPSADLLGDLAKVFQENPALTFEQIRTRTGASAPYTAAGLNRLAQLGQLIHDLPGGVYRWRQIMPPEVSLSQVKFDNQETVAAKEMLAKFQVKLSKNEKLESGLQVVEGEAGRKITLLLDADGRILRGKCNCSHHFSGGLRRGPCRHLQAARTAAMGNAPQVKTVQDWFTRYWNN